MLKQVVRALLKQVVQEMRKQEKKTKLQPKENPRSNSLTIVPHHCSSSPFH
jgi:hypothetical protein